MGEKYAPQAAASVLRYGVPAITVRGTGGRQSPPQGIRGTMGNVLFDLLFATADDRAFLMGPDMPVLTRAAFMARAGTMSAALSRSGLAKGDRLLAQLEPSADMIALYAACLRLGVVFVPLNPAMPNEEAMTCLTDCGARFAVVAPDKLARLRQMAAHLPVQLESLSHDATGSFADLARQADAGPVPPVTSCGPDDLAVILQSSGRGLRRRGVMLTHGALAQNTRAMVDLWGFHADDVLCHVLPLFHASGLTVALHSAAAGGGALWLLPRYDPQALMAGLARSTVLMAVPSHYTRLLTQRDCTRAGLAHMRLFLSGTAPLAADTHAAFARATGFDIHDRYATTETGVLTGLPADQPHPHGHCGRPLPGVALRITDEEGQTLPTGATGHVEAKTPAMFAGYVGQSAPALPPDGWLATGDLGHLTPEGELVLVGQANDLIVAGGFTVDAAEVEAALAANSAVRDSAVIGLPHPDWGETVVAIVVAADGSPPDPEDLVASLGHGLARFKLPRHVAYVDSLPRNALGRVQKAALRQQFAGLLNDI